MAHLKWPFLDYFFISTTGHYRHFTHGSKTLKRLPRMILEVVDAVLSESDLSAADQPPHQILRLVTHFDVRREVETVLQKMFEIMLKTLV